MEPVTIETDAAFMDTLEKKLLSGAFPDAEIEWEGPLREAALPPDAIQWVYAGSMAFFTITGGAGPAVDYIRAIVDYLRDGYRAASARSETLSPTVLKYRNREVSLDGDGVKFSETTLEVPWDDPEIAERIVKEVLEAHD